MARENNAAENLVWFLSGALAGACIAILYAPASGQVTRRLINKQAKRSKEALSEHGQRLMDRGRELYEKGRKMADDAGEMIDQGKKLVQG